MGYTVQLGTYAPVTDSWTLLVDCNDGQTFELEAIDGVEMPHPGLAAFTSSHARAHGIRVSHTQYEERDITISMVAGPSASYATLQTALQKLLLAQETVRIARNAAQLGINSATRLALQLQPPGSSTPVFADVQIMAQDIPNIGDTPAWVRLWQHGITLQLTCAPFLSGKSTIIQNWVTNPGMEAPASTGINVFNDPFNNFNAYTVSGSALTQDKSLYSDAVMADSPIRYYRLDEASGTTAYDAMGTGFNGTYTAPTFSQGGALTGDSDTSVYFNGSTSIVTTASTGLPSGNSPWTLECWVNMTALPAGTGIFMAYGTQNTKQRPALNIDNTGTIHAEVYSAQTGGYTITTGSFHHVVGTWDGTTLTVYVDGSSRGTATPGALNVAFGNGLTIGADSASLYFVNGRVDEAAVYNVALSATRITAHYNAGHNTPASAASTMSIPTSTRMQFGSPEWGAVNVWKVRFRANAAMNASFYLHYVDANNNLVVIMTATTAFLDHGIGGTGHILANANFNLINGVNYWLLFTQFPGTGTIPPHVNAYICYDVAGTLGNAFVTLGPIGTFDAVTALQGQMAITNASGAVTVGISSNSVALFGPGAWTYTSSGTSLAAGAWEQNTSNTYPNGPVTSFGAARIDAPPTGAWNAQWIAATTIKTTAAPVATAGNTLGVGVWVLGSGLAGTCTISLSIVEYDSTGTFLRTTATGQSVTGPASSWTQLLTTSYTTGASCAYAALQVIATDSTSGSANGTVWLDNAQIWNVTTTGLTTMPYAELCFPTSPAQLMVSGLVGDVPAPCRIDIGTLPAGSGLAAGSSLALYAGRRAVSGAKARLVGAPYVSSPDGTNNLLALDTTTGSGYRAIFLTAGATYAPLYFTGQVSDLYGVYHLFVRLYELDASPTTQNLQADVYLVPSAWLGGGRATYKADYHAAFTYPWATQNTWTLIDAGQIAIPPGPIGASGDPTQVYATAFVQSTTLTTGMFADMAALLPVDAEVLVANYINETIGSTITSWVWCYFDGLAQLATGQTSATWSQESNGLPNVSHSAGAPGTIQSGSPSLQSIGDSYAVADPQLTTTTGQPNTGVNQWVVVSADSSANMLPVKCQLTYRPQYLQVR